MAGSIEDRQAGFWKSNLVFYIWICRQQEKINIELDLGFLKLQNSPPVIHFLLQCPTYSNEVIPPNPSKVVPLPDDSIKTEQLRIIHIYFLSSRRHRKTHNLEVHSLQHIPLNESNLERGRQVTLRRNS